MQEDKNTTEPTNDQVENQDTVQAKSELSEERSEEPSNKLAVDEADTPETLDSKTASDELSENQSTDSQSEPVDVDDVAEDAIATTEEVSSVKPAVDVPEEAASKETTADADKPSADHEKEDAPEEDPIASLSLDEAEKAEVYQALKQFANTDDMRLVDRALKAIKPHFDKIHADEKEKALQDYLKEPGTEKEGFQYKGDDIDANFFVLYNSLRDKKQKYFSQLSKDKESNLKRKNEILDQIRNLVDGEETNVSIDQIKALQSEWKAIGPVHGQYAKTLWANYNALLDRFYDNRSIYFELKELDRKKNLEAKFQLCEKAEALNDEKNINKAIAQLNDLHEEFKHIGPVPKEEQDALWDRFKLASDNIYLKRKDFYQELKEKQSENVSLKMEIGNEAEELSKFDSDKITEWNQKTKEILELQKKWESAGGVPKEKSKEVNKHFWSSFKLFFSNKNAFFKKLDADRQVNLEKKKELLKRAESLKQSTAWDETTNELKTLQQEWRDIGPVPEKFRNDIYKKFKAACDAFFDNKRSDSSGQGLEFSENLKKKEEVCSMLEAYLNTDDIALEEVFGLIDKYSEIGFVPKESIDAIHQRFDGIIAQLLSFEELTEGQKNEIQIKIEVNKLKNSPHGAQKLNRKESAIRRKIGELENEIGTFQTNMDFFAASKNADKLKDELSAKVVKAEEEIIELKRQLKVFKQM